LVTQSSQAEARAFSSSRFLANELTAMMNVVLREGSALICPDVLTYLEKSRLATFQSA
jgi:hypothetical protein